MGQTGVRLPPFYFRVVTIMHAIMVILKKLLREGCRRGINGNGKNACFLKRLLKLLTLFSWNHTLSEDEAWRGVGETAAPGGACRGCGKHQVWDQGTYF